mgnify:FL=1
MKETLFPSLPLDLEGLTTFWLAASLVVGCPLFLPMAMTDGCCLAIIYIFYCDYKNIQLFLN